MDIYYTILDLQKAILVYRRQGASIGFVPTMGALHKGHLSLISKAKQENDIVVCSIFVNPVQFNNKEDFEKYPHTENEDIQLLNKEKCDLLFTPSQKEIYPDSTHNNLDFNFGDLDKVMEGKYRSGHFKGVAIVVKRLLEIVLPNKAYFGEKDFQQLAIVKVLVKQCFPTIDIVPCPIMREADGLAMSSRNMRLTIEERKVVSLIYKTLFEAKTRAQSNTVFDLKQWVEGEINAQPLMKLEYFEISNINTLNPIENWEVNQKYIACIAVFIGKVRLIDNMIIEINKK